MAVRLSALRAGHPLPPGRFLVLFSVRGWVDPRAIVRLEGVGKLKKKKSNDLTGNRTRNLPACRIVAQPTTPPRAPIILYYTTEPGPNFTGTRFESLPRIQYSGRIYVQFYSVLIRKCNVEMTMFGFELIPLDPRLTIILLDIIWR
jgi:hypothetical protein